MKPTTDKRRKDWGDPELFVVTRLLENGTFLGLLRGQGYDINAHNFDLNGEQFWSSPQRVQREIYHLKKMVIFILLD